MNNQINTENKFKQRTLVRLLGTSAVAMTFGFSAVAPALAAIDNTAKAIGTYSTSDDTESATSTATVPVIDLNPSLVTVISASEPTSANGDDASNPDGGDTITITYTLTNDGNTTLSGVGPDTSNLPTFGGIDGTGTFGTIAHTGSSTTLAPGESTTFAIEYTLTDKDIAAAIAGSPQVELETTSSGTLPDGTTDYVDPAPSTMEPTSPFGGTTPATVSGSPSLEIAKTAALDDTNGSEAGKAEVGEVITYTYVVTNTGTVPLNDVKVTDEHEGVDLPAGAFVVPASVDTEGHVGTSVDSITTDNSWGLLQPGATITFTYTHTVTQAEVDGG